MTGVKTHKVALITGVTGQDGAYLSELLLEKGYSVHALQGGWYRFLVGAKVEELEQAMAGLTDRSGRLEALSRLTGHRLDQADDDLGTELEGPAT